MWTRGLKVSCRYSSVETNKLIYLLIKKQSEQVVFLTSPRLDLVLLQLIDLHLRELLLVQHAHHLPPEQRKLSSPGTTNK
uniref:Uncharacterized protein n=1 Tax=Mastacembelus armatus TaxID=205130 RepID=A0A3Q3MIH6_9TELE